MTEAALSVNSDDDWVVCLGETRTVIGGAVPCPLRDERPVSVVQCAACHLLAWRHDERGLRPPCSTATVEVS